MQKIELVSSRGTLFGCHRDRETACHDAIAVRTKNPAVDGSDSQIWFRRVAGGSAELHLPRGTLHPFARFGRDDAIPKKAGPFAQNLGE